MGTPHYMSPEQARGQRAGLDERADTWAVGLIAYRLLTGVPYFAPLGFAGLLPALLLDPMRRPSALSARIPAGFDAWFARSCSRKLGERFRSPLAQVRALAEALAAGAELAAKLAQAC